MISINLKIKILRPIWEVFEFITRPENNPQWQYGAIATVHISAGEMQVGTLFSSIGHFMGRRIQSNFEVTEFEPNNSYGFETISGPIQLQTSYSFEAVKYGTIVIVSSLVNPGSFFKLVEPIVARTAKKQFKENLAGLKKLLETREIVHNY